MTDAPLRLLYVDDDRINTLLFVEICRPDPGLQVSTAADADEAVEFARERPLDVLVIDLHLPDTDGLRLLQRLRALPGLQHVPAFLCTAERLDDVHDAARTAGFRAVWGKPVQLDSIRAALTDALPAA